MQSSETYEGMILNNLATMYSDQEDWIRAEKTYREAIATNTAAFAGKDNTTLAAAIHGLATVVQLDTARSAEAEDLHYQSLSMKEKLLGIDHPSVAISLSGIADFYVATNRRPQAIATVERGLKILRDAYGGI
jgi:tetratricopeptide (TPR) repeat protein